MGEERQGRNNDDAAPGGDDASGGGEDNEGWSDSTSAYSPEFLDDAFTWSISPLPESERGSFEKQEDVLNPLVPGKEVPLVPVSRVVLPVDQFTSFMGDSFAYTLVTDHKLTGGAVRDYLRQRSRLLTYRTRDKQDTVINASIDLEHRPVRACQKGCVDITGSRASTSSCNVCGARR